MVQISPGPARAAGTKAQRRQLEILSAASRVFRRRGLHGTGMRDIAAESGMQVGNLYYYFRNKQELLAFCQRQTLDGLIALAGKIRRQAIGADAKLFQLIVGHVVRLNDELPGSLAHLEVEALDEQWRAEILRQRDRYEALVRVLIEEGTGAGLFRPTDVKVTTRALLGAVNWTVKWYQPRRGKSSDQIGREIAELLVRGLLAPGRELHARGLLAGPPGGTEREPRARATGLRRE